MDKKYYYKAMSKDMRGWKGFQYKLGETYSKNSKDLDLCSNQVFHFCENLEDTIQYYSRFSDRHFLIEVLGDIFTEGNISCSNKIRIVREISRDEIFKHIKNKKSLNTHYFVALFTKNVNILEKLANSPHWGIRETVVKNANTPMRLIFQLLNSNNIAIALRYAEYPKTPDYILKVLCKHTSVDVRSAVATHPNATPYILEELAKDKYWIVRTFVVRNPNTTVKTLEKLAKDPDPHIRLIVALVPKTPKKLLKVLLKDWHNVVKTKAEERLNNLKSTNKKKRKKSSKKQSDYIFKK